LLNFWRKDCQYCTREKGYLKKLVKDIGRPDLEAVCVNLWDNPEWIAGQYGREPGGALLYATRPDNRPWVMENRVRGQLMGYYVLNEANEAIYEIKGFPSTYVIDKDGRVVASHLGMVEWTNPPVLSWLLGLLRAPNARQSVETAEYALPDWIDRLLSNNVVDQDALSGTAIRRANLAPRK
ncbi:MAG: redoxin domain-containing protein, partial [Deltaproteobacteria bacterium]|nr:redoxin domain-containing protein [Deltaproteobacteria bacterium]